MGRVCNGSKLLLAEFAMGRVAPEPFKVHKGRISLSVVNDSEYHFQQTNHEFNLKWDKMFCVILVTN